MFPENPEVIAPIPPTPGQTEPQPLHTPDVTHEMPPSGRRLALSELRRTLTEEELKNPGAIKLILDELERVDNDCEILKGYVDRFHDADKQAAVLKERQKSITSIEIAYGFGMALGGVIIGLAPTFGTKESQTQVIIAVGIGLVLMIGALFMRWKKG